MPHAGNAVRWLDYFKLKGTNMNEASERVLLKFATLLKNNPNGNVPFLWVQAGGKVASQQSFAPDPPSALVCECGSLYGVHEEFCPKFKTAGR